MHADTAPSLSDGPTDRLGYNLTAGTASVNAQGAWKGLAHGEWQVQERAGKCMKTLEPSG